MRTWKWRVLRGRRWWWAISPSGRDKRFDEWESAYRYAARHAYA